MSQNNGDDRLPPPDPKRILSLNPTLKAEAPQLFVNVLYDPVNKVIGLKYSPQLDVVGIVGILELAKDSMVRAAAARR